MLSMIATTFAMVLMAIGSIASPVGVTPRDSSFQVNFYSDPYCADYKGQITGTSGAGEVVTRSLDGSYIGAFVVVSPGGSDSMYMKYNGSPDSDGEFIIYWGPCGDPTGDPWWNVAIGEEIGPCFAIGIDVTEVLLGTNFCDATGIDNIYLSK